MSNLIRGEFYKLRKSKYFIGTIILTLVVAVFLIGRWNSQEIKLIIHNHNSIIYGINSISYGFSYIGYTSFIFALLAGEFIAKDFKNSNISRNFTYGYKRSKVILSKLIVIIPFFLLLELLYMTILVVYASRNNGFCEVLDSNTILYLVKVIIVGVMYNIALISIVAMIAIITKSNFYTITFPVIFLITSVIDIGYLSYIMPSVAGRAATEVLSTEVDVIKSVIVSILTFIMAIGGSLFYIKHSDIK